MKTINETINDKKLFVNHLSKSDRYLAHVKCGFAVSHLFISELKKLGIINTQHFFNVHFL